MKCSLSFFSSTAFLTPEKKIPLIATTAINTTIPKVQNIFFFTIYPPHTQYVSFIECKYCLNIYHLNNILQDISIKINKVHHGLGVTQLIDVFASAIAEGASDMVSIGFYIFALVMILNGFNANRKLKEMPAFESIQSEGELVYDIDKAEDNSKYEGSRLVV
jgi:hypothetical protein